MTDPYYSRKSKDDSGLIAGFCFVGIVVLFAVLAMVGLVRWVAG